MKDRELLRLAAKAIGLKVDLMWSVNCDGTWNNFLDCEGRTWRVWNPLDDDGDAFRLAIKLGICIQFIPECDTAQVYQERSTTAEPYNIHVAGFGDIETRRIIVQAAAEIGKQMP